VIIVGAATAILGFLLAVNLLKSADNLAASARTMPWWRAGNPFAGSAMHWRLLGAAFLVIGVGLMLVGLGFPWR
jgi:hypothetical protein